MKVKSMIEMLQGMEDPEAELVLFIKLPFGITFEAEIMGAAHGCITFNGSRQLRLSLGEVES